MTATPKRIADLFALPLWMRKKQDGAYPVYAADGAWCGDMPDKKVAEAVIRATNCHDDLLAALKDLANEVIGITGAAEPMLREAIGNTNYTALVVKAQIARRAIAKAEARS